MQNYTSSESFYEDIQEQNSFSLLVYTDKISSLLLIVLFKNHHDEIILLFVKYFNQQIKL